MGGIGPVRRSRSARAAVPCKATEWSESMSEHRLPGLALHECGHRCETREEALLTNHLPLS